MAITSEEQVDLFLQKQSYRRALERDLEQFRLHRDAIGGGGNNVDFVLRTVTYEEVFESMKMIDDYLEEKIANVNDEIEEMLK